MCSKRRARAKRRVRVSVRVFGSVYGRVGGRYGWVHGGEESRGDLGRQRRPINVTAYPSVRTGQSWQWVSLGSRRQGRGRDRNCGSSRAATVENDLRDLRGMRRARGEDLQVRGELGCPGVCLGLGCGLADGLWPLEKVRVSTTGSASGAAGSGRARRSDPAPKMCGWEDPGVCSIRRCACRFDASTRIVSCTRVCRPKAVGLQGPGPRSRAAAQVNKADNRSAAARRRLFGIAGRVFSNARAMC